MYSFHEIESALSLYSKGASSPTKEDDWDKRVHTWDEMWAFYAGSLESGLVTGYGPFILAEKRSKFFGTNTAKTPNGGPPKLPKQRPSKSSPHQCARS